MMVDETDQQKLPLNRIREGIPALARSTYLNSGTNGPNPSPVLDVQHRWLDDLASEGAAGWEMMARRAAVLVEARQALAELLHATPEEVALTSSTSQGLNWVLEAFPWQDGDELLVPAHEYPVVAMAAYLRERRHGIRVREVVLEDEAGTPFGPPIELLERARGPRTRMICFSHVRYDNGLRRDAPAICRWARAEGIRTLIDGAQAVGAVPVDLAALGCDFYACSGQKWLLGPEGTGGLFVASDQLETLTPPEVGYLGVVSFEASQAFRFKASASRFLGPYPHTGVWAGFREALRWLRALGVERTTERIADLALCLKIQLAMVPDIEVLSPTSPARSAGLVTFRIARQGVDHEAIARRWYREEGLLVRTIPDADGKAAAIRASTHYFNTEGELARLVALAAQIT